MTDGTTRRVVVDRDGINVIRSTVPRPRPDEVLVEMTVSGVCGSDTHAAVDEHPFIDLPYYPGHEVVGVVREIGDAVTTVDVGSRITVEPTLPCWTCKMCRTGRENICENLRFFGTVYEQGGMADYFTVPANRVHAIPESMSDLEAALIEPLATPVHAVRLSGDVQGKAVVILGSGTIGLLLLAAARHAGARQVVMTDVVESKRARATRLGADAVFDSTCSDAVAQIRAHLGESADVVFDCVAIQPTMDQAVALASKGGIVVVVGIAARPLTVPVPTIQDHQIRIQGSATYRPEDYATAVEIIRGGKVSAEDFVTAQFTLDEAADAFAASAAGEEVKVLVTRNRLA